MLQLLREGYWRDLLALFLVTALLGAAVVAGAGRATAAYLEGALETVVGAPGEFDLIVHVRRESEREAVAALGDLLASIDPDHTLREGPVVAGRAHLLAGLSNAVESRSLFESLGSRLESIPGYDGMTFMVEPSVVLKDVHPALAGRLLQEAESLPRVRFAFRHGGSVWAVLDSAEAADEVQEELERRLASFALVDVRFPLAVAPEALAESARGLVEQVSEAFPGASAELLERGETPLSKEVSTLRRVLSQLAGGEELRRRLAEAASLLEQLETSGQVGPALEAIATFREALGQIEVLQRQVESVAGQLRGVAAEGKATEILVAMLLQRLLDQLGSESPVQDREGQVDVERLEAGLNAMEEQLRRFESLDLAGFAQMLREAEHGLPLLSAGELARLEEGLARLEEAWGAGDRLEVLVEGEWSEEGLAALAREVAGDGARVSIHPAAVVETDARTAVMRLLERAEGVILALLSLLMALLFLITDCAVVVSYCKRRAEGSGARALGARAGTDGFAGAWGAALVCLFAHIGGGSAVSPWALAGIGFAVGLLVALAAPRISPVSPAPVDAGLSLGMSEAEIVREVILPGGRPGLLFLLNRWWRRGALRMGREHDAAVVQGG